MPPHNRRTVIIKTGNFPSSLSAAKMVECITSHLHVSSVEVVKNYSWPAGQNYF